MAGFSIRTFLDNIRSLGAEPEQRSSNLVALEQFGDNLFTNATKSGQAVTYDSALTLSAVWAAISIISDIVATFPFQVVERTEHGRQLAGFHPLYNVIHRNPNDKMTSVSFRAAMMHRALTRGEAFIWIHREPDERDTWLEIVDNDEVEVRQDERRVYYDVRGRGTVQSYDMIHIKGFTLDGVRGLSPIAYHKETIGAGVSGGAFAGEMMSNGITQKVYASTPGNQPTEDQVDYLSKILRRKFGRNTTGNTDGIPVLFGGMELKPISITPEDAQFLEQRKFNVAEVARIFRVPPHLIGDVDRSTSWGSGIEQQNIAFVQYCLLPWIKSIEQEFDTKLFKEADKARFGVKLTVDGLLRGDIATRSAHYHNMVNDGIFLVNEVRKMEGMPPIEGGDIPRVPVNQTTVEKMQSDET